MYVAVKGGEAAILSSYDLLAEQRRGNTDTPELSVTQIREQLKLAVDRVMTEGSVYDPELAALAIKQASGDLVEAIFLLRAYRSTLPRLGTSVALDTARMQLDRRISATFKDLPGGQVLGATYDYTQRLLDFSLLASGEPPAQKHIDAEAEADAPAVTPRVVDLLNHEGLIETHEVPPGDPAPVDLTRRHPHRADVAVFVGQQHDRGSGWRRCGRCGTTRQNRSGAEDDGDEGGDDDRADAGESSRRSGSGCGLVHCGSLRSDQKAGAAHAHGGRG